MILDSFNARQSGSAATVAAVSVEKYTVEAPLLLGGH